MVVTIAFSNAARVMILRGVSPARTRRTAASPARRQSSTLLADTASWALEFGRLIPSASMAEAIVLAVYMPPQLPGPGMAVASTSCNVASDTVPAARPPTASNTETMSRRCAPGRMVPP